MEENKVNNVANIKSEVFAFLTVEGLHKWDGAVDFPEVSYLSFLHRHQFHIKAYVPVNHDDRDVEFIMLKHRIAEFLEDSYYNAEYRCLVFGAMSCEAIARELISEFNLTKCEVSEDGECGAVLCV